MTYLRIEYIETSMCCVPIVGRLTIITLACFLPSCLQICIDLKDECFSTFDKTSYYKVIKRHITYLLLFFPEQFECGPLLIWRYAAVLRAKTRTVRGDVILFFPLLFLRGKFLNDWKPDRRMYVSLSPVDLRWQLVWPA